jgi:flagellar biogenesis protein FliO
MSAAFLIASTALALALISARSWFINRIIRDRRACDRSERP